MIEKRRAGGEWPISGGFYYLDKVKLDQREKNKIRKRG